MKVVQGGPNADYFVQRDGVNIAGPFQTHASAWREIDRLSMTPINPSQARAQWIFDTVLSTPAAPTPKGPEDE